MNRTTSAALLIAVSVLFTGVSAVNYGRMYASLEAASAQQPSEVVQGVVIRPNGAYLIDRTREVVPDMDLTDGEQPAQARMLPTRVIFGEKLADDLSVCREREDGTTDCKTLGQLFPTGVKK